MSPLTKAVHDYLALRRSLGFKLHDAGVALAGFRIVHGTATGPACITTELALAWAEQPSNAHACTLGATPEPRAMLRAPSPRQRSEHRGSTTRLVAVPSGARPAIPLFGAMKIAAPDRAGACSCPAIGLRPWTYHALLGLLSVTGMRVGEALRLKLRGCRPRHWRAHRARHQVRQVAAGADPRLDSRGPGPLPRTPGQASGRPRGSSTSSSPALATHSTAVTCGAPSTTCRARSACAGRRTATARACMIFVIDSRSRRCWVGTGRVRMPSGACRCCRPTSAMCM